MSASVIDKNLPQNLFSCFDKSVGYWIAAIAADVPPGIYNFRIRMNQDAAKN